MCLLTGLARTCGCMFPVSNQRGTQYCKLTKKSQWEVSAFKFHSATCNKNKEFTSKVLHKVVATGLTWLLKCCQNKFRVMSSKHDLIVRNRASLCQCLLEANHVLLVVRHGGSTALCRLHYRHTGLSNTAGLLLEKSFPWFTEHTLCPQLVTTTNTVCKLVVTWL